MSPTLLVLTAIGSDRPGLVEELASLVSECGGNWLDSSLAHLAGKFAGLVQVAVPAERADELRQALQAFQPLRIVVEQAHGDSGAGARTRSLALSLVGHDRIGIVREVSQVLARHAVNVESLNTWTSAAPMSGETLFHASAALKAAASLDTGVLQRDLEAISNELQVDIVLDAAQS